MNVDVIDRFPDAPLRAGLIKKKRIVELGAKWGVHWRPNSESYIRYDDNQFEYDLYKVPSQAILLHPTGEKGQGVCPDCEGMCEDIWEQHPEPCPTCNGTGYVPAMIYEWDVVMGDLRKQKKPKTDVFIVSWFNGCWRINCDWVSNYHLGEVHDPLTVVCSLFEADKTTKPEDLSDEQWAWVLEQRGRLLNEETP